MENISPHTFHLIIPFNDIISDSLSTEISKNLPRLEHLKRIVEKIQHVKYEKQNFKPLIGTCKWKSLLFREV